MFLAVLAYTISFVHFFTLSNKHSNKWVIFKSNFEVSIKKCRKIIQVKLRNDFCSITPAHTLSGFRCCNKLTKKFWLNQARPSTTVEIKMAVKSVDNIFERLGRHREWTEDKVLNSFVKCRERLRRFKATLNGCIKKSYTLFDESSSSSSSSVESFLQTILPRLKITIR